MAAHALETADFRIEVAEGEARTAPRLALGAVRAAVPAVLLPYVVVLVGCELLLVALHGLWPGVHFLDLDREFNLPTWFSSAQLLLVGLACVAAFEAERHRSTGFRRSRWVWLLLALGFFYMSADESLVLHEKFLRESLTRSLGPTSLLHGLVPWQLLFAPVLVAGIVTVCGVVYTRFCALRGVGALAVCGLGMWAASIVLEGLAKPVFMPLGLYDLEATLEEVAEMLGATCLLTAVTHYSWAVVEGKIQRPRSWNLQARSILRAAAVLAGVPVVLLSIGLWIQRGAVHKGAAAALEGDGLVAPAVTAYRAALEETPGDPELWHGLGKSARDAGDYVTAIWAYKRLVRLRPDDPYAWNDLGVAYHRLGRLRQAVGAYRHAEHFDAAVNNRLLAHLQLGDLAAAAACYRRMLNGDAGSRAAAGRLLAQLGVNGADLPGAASEC